MITPSASELARREDLAPTLDIAAHLAEAIAAVNRYERKATVVVTYDVTYNDDLQTLAVTNRVKSKRPVAPSRNEEVIGDDADVLRLVREVPGQQRLDRASDSVLSLHQHLKDNDSSLTMHYDVKSVTIGKDAAAGA
jgi:hypothetical protein